MLESVTSCVRKQHSTSAPQGGGQQKRSLIDTDSCFGDLSDSLNSLKVLFDSGKLPLSGHSSIA